MSETPEVLGGEVAFGPNPQPPTINAHGVWGAVGSAATAGKTRGWGAWCRKMRGAGCVCVCMCVCMEYVVWVCVGGYAVCVCVYVVWCVCECE